MKELIKSFIVDDHVFVGRKRVSLNMNVYRNLHYQTNNKAKVIFMNNLISEYPDLKKIKAKKIKICYSVLVNNNRLFDLMNIVSIVDKFFLDSLVNIGCIPDDNYKIVSYDAPCGLIGDKKKTDNQILIICKFNF